MTPLGFTGTRHGMTGAQHATVYNIIRDRKPDDVHHGGCIGADSEFDRIAYTHGCIRWVHPGPDVRMQRWAAGGIELPSAPYLVRNRLIVDCAYEMIAAPRDTSEQSRGGTWYTIRYAVSRSRPVCIVWPNGSVSDA